jgi:hypothetical protein
MAYRTQPPPGINKPYNTTMYVDQRKQIDLFSIVLNLDTTELLEYSLANKVSLNISNGNDDNLIHVIIKLDPLKASEHIKLNIIKFLIDNDVNPDKQNKNNQTPLHLACEEQYPKIVGYLLDGTLTPGSGIGSVIRFDGLDEGVLSRAGRTIRAALELEKAAELYAKEPVPTMVLKSNGTNLTPERISRLLESWKTARSTRATAFLNADVELTALGFDPAKLQLNEARQYVALEIARAAGIPAYFISAETTSMTYSNSVSERKSLIDFSLRAILTCLEQRLSMPDFTPYGTEIRFSVDDFLRGDALQRAQVYEILNRIGAMSIEQIQEEEDLIK